MLVHVLNSSGLPAKHLISFPYFTLEGFTYSCYIQKRAFLFCKHFCIQLNSVIQNVSGRKPGFWYYDILQIIFWSRNSNCTVLSKRRSHLTWIQLDMKSLIRQYAVYTSNEMKS